MFGIHHDLDPGQVSRQRSAVGAAGPDAHGATIRIIRLDAGGVLGLALLDLLERRFQLIDRQGLGAPAEAVALEFLDDLREPFDLGRVSRSLNRDVGVMLVYNYIRQRAIGASSGLSFGDNRIALTVTFRR